MRLYYDRVLCVLCSMCCVENLYFTLCLRFSCYVFFFFKQKTAYEMRISDWSSDVCSSDLRAGHHRPEASGRSCSWLPCSQGSRQPRPSPQGPPCDQAEYWPCAASYVLLRYARAVPRRFPHTGSAGKG